MPRLKYLKVFAAPWPFRHFSVTSARYLRTLVFRFCWWRTICSAISRNGAQPARAREKKKRNAKQKHTHTHAGAKVATERDAQTHQFRLDSPVRRTVAHDALRRRRQLPKRSRNLDNAFECRTSFFFLGPASRRRAKMLQSAHRIIVKYSVGRNMCFALNTNVCPSQTHNYMCAICEA